MAEVDIQPSFGHELKVRILDPALRRLFRSSILTGRL